MLFSVFIWLGIHIYHFDSSIFTFQVLIIVGWFLNCLPNLLILEFPPHNSRM